jgi:hypothetical protein
MELIIGPARSGKTIELVKLSSKTQMPIVCVNSFQSKNLHRVAQTLGIDIPEPICFDRLPIHSQNHRGVLVDNADMILDRLVGRPVVAASFTGSAEIEYSKSPNEPDRKKFRTQYEGALEDMP